MKRTLLLLAAITATLPAAFGETIPFNRWPQLKIPAGRILVAEHETLAHQGFGGAPAADFRNTYMWFPGISGGTGFGNIDHGYGPVVRDLGIAFISTNGRILKLSVMKAGVGYATAPEGTCAALEALPALLKKAGFRQGGQAPFTVDKIDGYMSNGNHFTQWTVWFPAGKRMKRHHEAAVTDTTTWR
jgi:hypothetical protein